MEAGDFVMAEVTDAPALSSTCITPACPPAAASHSGVVPFFDRQLACNRASAEFEMGDNRRYGQWCRPLIGSLAVAGCGILMLRGLRYYDAKGGGGHAVGVRRIMMLKEAVVMANG
jgi:hypothetical protein